MSKNVLSQLFQSSLAEISNHALSVVLTFFSNLFLVICKSLGFVRTSQQISHNLCPQVFHWVVPHWSDVYRLVFIGSVWATISSFNFWRTKNHICLWQLYHTLCFIRLSLWHQGYSQWTCSKWEVFIPAVARGCRFGCHHGYFGLNATFDVISRDVHSTAWWRNVLINRWSLIDFLNLCAISLFCS